MTREEAIKVLSQRPMIAPSKSNKQKKFEEATDMAIEALQAEAVTLVKPNTAYCENGEWRVKTETSYLIELVRCKDCRWCQNDYMGTWCGRFSGVRFTQADDFCSHGERQCNYFGERREP